MADPKNRLAVFASLRRTRNAVETRLAAGPALAIGFWVGTSAAVGLAQDESSPPAEEFRLDRKTFHEGLKKRGLTEILDLHLKEFPPQGVTAHLLIRRDVELARFADPGLPKEERMRAVAEANRILEELIERDGNDPRRFRWLFDLAHSLVYDEAEPFFTNILYQGGTSADRRSLLGLTTRAVGALTTLSQQLELEYSRIDGLPIETFEQLERNGYVEDIDRLKPQLDYLLLWTVLYDSLPRDDHDPTRLRRLNHIRNYLAGHREMLETPHDDSHVQVQVLLLAGMTARLLNDHLSAREHLDHAIAAAERLTDDAERARVSWAVTLAQIERVRNDRDDGRFEAAGNALKRLRERVTTESGNSFGLHVVAALLERSVLRARAALAEREGRPRDGQRYRDRSWQPLMGLVRSGLERRDEVYATVYGLIEPDATADSLDPFEQCALIAGLLFDASEHAAEAETLLDKAILVGERFLAEPADATRPLIPEVLYNTTVARYRRGHIVEAARGFRQVADEHPTFPSALSAAILAVQLSAGLYEDPALHNHPEAQELYLKALATLVHKYADTDAARYWRFYYAQLLDELGRYEDAAEEYALVDSEHELHLESVFFRLRCLARAVQAQVAQAPADPLALGEVTNVFFNAQHDFVTRVGGNLVSHLDSGRALRLQSYLARSKLLAAEIQVLPQVNRHAQALKTLSNFESTFSEETAVAGRVWRVRLLAYEALGRVEEAAKAIPAYIAADPENAGPTLKSIYAALAADIDRLTASGDERAIQRKAEVALVVARQIAEWEGQYQQNAPAAERRAVAVRLAEAHLQAGLPERARELFEPLLPSAERSAVSKDPLDLRVAAGYAECLFELDQFALALPRFNALAVRLSPTDPLRWESLLRDLQCRSALGHPPGDIMKVLQQQRLLYPELGGPGLARQFEKLQRETQRRLDGG